MSTRWKQDHLCCEPQGASVSPLQSVAEEVQNNALGKGPLVSEVEERTPRCASETLRSSCDRTLVARQFLTYLATE